MNIGAQNSVLDRYGTSTPALPGLIDRTANPQLAPQVVTRVPRVQTRPADTSPWFDAPRYPAKAYSMLSLWGADPELAAQPRRAAQMPWLR